MQIYIVMSYTTFSVHVLSHTVDSSNDTAVRDAVTMSWKYAAMEIYGLLSDVRDTDAEEMNVRELVYTYQASA